MLLHLLRESFFLGFRSLVLRRMPFLRTSESGAFEAVGLFASLPSELPSRYALVVSLPRDWPWPNLHRAMPCRGRKSQRLLSLPSFLLTLVKSIYKLFRDSRPVGSLHAFALGQSLNPYPAYYRPAFAFSDILLPAFSSAFLAIRLPEGENTGLPRSA